MSTWRPVAFAMMLMFLCTLASTSAGDRAAPPPAAPLLAALIPAGREGDDAAVLRGRYSLPPAQWPKAWVDAGVDAPELQPLPPVAYPAKNPWSESKARLGRLLFFDPRLSASGQIACASCHDPQFGWADGRRLATGFARSEGVMNTPSIVNAGHEAALFWDGRAASAEAQIPGSLGNAIEMNTPVRRATAAIAAIKLYRPLIESAYGDSRANWQRLCDAIATYVRGVELRDTAYDRFLQGDSGALSDAAVRGLNLFRTKARCMNCHSGALLSDGRYHHLGTSFFGVGNYQGRYAVTHDPSDMGHFRTPGLRGVLHTGPWMHNGLINDMDSLLAMYNKGWWQNAKPDAEIDDAKFPRLDALIKPLNLSKEELSDLKMFLESMSPPPRYLPPPELPGIRMPRQASLNPR
jgi:cytochrome c peroxidase